MPNKEKKNNSGKVVHLDVQVKKSPKKITEPKPSQGKKSQEILSADEIIKQARTKHTHKLFVMWSGVTFFMLLIMSVWFFNIQDVFSVATKRTQIEDDFEFEEIKKMTADMGEQFGELKKIFEEASQSSTTDDNVLEAVGDDQSEFNPLPNFDDSDSQEVSVKGISNEDVEILKDRLLEIFEKK